GLFRSPSYAGAATPDKTTLLHHRFGVAPGAGSHLAFAHSPPPVYAVVPGQCVQIGPHKRPIALRFRGLRDLFHGLVYDFRLLQDLRNGRRRKVLVAIVALQTVGGVSEILHKAIVFMLRGGLVERRNVEHIIETLAVVLGVLVYPR